MFLLLWGKFMYQSPCRIRIAFFTIKFWVINSNLLKQMSNFPSDAYRWKWKGQNGLEFWSGLAMIWSKLTSFMLCCSAVQMWLRCILWLRTIWQYRTARIQRILSTGRWWILTLLIQGTTVLKNVSCSYAARVLDIPNFLTCLQSSVVTIIVTNLSKSDEVYLPYGPAASAVYMWCWFVIVI